MVDSIKMIDKIKRLCNEKNIKISELEEEVGLSKGNLSRWAKSCPSAIQNLANIAEILNISVDYLLDTNTRLLASDNNVLDILISETKNRSIVWQKLSYSKCKKISVINCVNEIIYKSNVAAYETNFNNKHLIFVLYKNTGVNQLYIENNNDYIIICDNDSYAERISQNIEQERMNAIDDFFSYNNKGDTN